MITYTQVQTLRKQAWDESYSATVRNGKVVGGNMTQEQYDRYKQDWRQMDKDIHDAEMRMNDQIWAKKKQQKPVQPVRKPVQKLFRNQFKQASKKQRDSAKIMPTVDLLQGNKLTPEQIKQIRALDYALYNDQEDKITKIVGESEPRLSFAKFKSKYKDSDYGDKNIQYSLLNDNGNIKGMVQMDYVPRFRMNHVMGVYVDPSMRGKGYGAKLLAAALNGMEPKHPGKHTELSVIADNTPAQELYKKFGFTVPVTTTQARLPKTAVFNTDDPVLEHKRKPTTYTMPEWKPNFN